MNDLSKVGCVFAMVVVSILPYAEFGRNDHREDAPHFKRYTSKLDQSSNGQIYVGDELVRVLVTSKLSPTKPKPFRRNLPFSRIFSLLPHRFVLNMLKEGAK